LQNRVVLERSGLPFSIPGLRGDRQTAARGLFVRSYRRAGEPKFLDVSLSAVVPAGRLCWKSGDSTSALAISIARALSYPELQAIAIL
jgi:hypothetical protein